MSEMKYMIERYKEIHHIRIEIEKYIRIAGHTRVYRNRGKRPRCGTPFFNVEFREIVDLYRASCRCFPVEPESGQGIG